MDRPFVLCGLGRMGSRVLEHLHQAGFSVVVIDTVCKSDDPRLGGARLVVQMQRIAPAPGSVMRPW